MTRRRRGRRGGRGRGRGRGKAAAAASATASAAAPTALQILKTSGEQENFDERKLRSSLRRSGATAADQDRVLAEVRRHLVPGLSSKQLFRIAFQVLRHATGRSKRTAGAAARYSLQHAILELGPSGFPFEQFLGELMRHEGWRVKVGARLRGRYVPHEVDIDAQRDDRRVLAECKFRLDPNGKVDVKTALYVYGRAIDLRSIPGGYDEFWLVTNGRFTDDARRFGEGMGLYMLGWNHPKGDSLRERIDRAGLHPVTCLTNLRKADKQVLLRAGIVVVADLHDYPRELERLGLTANRLRQVRSEVDALCGG